MAKTATATAPKTAPKGTATPAVNSPELDRALATVKATVKVYDAKMKARDKATLAALTAKVQACREIITLMTFKETFASRGPSAGKPSVSIIAELLGYPRQTFTPLFRGAEALRDYYTTLDADTVKGIMGGATPTEKEQDLASVGLASEADRSRNNRLKAKADKPNTTGGTGGTDGDTDGEGEGEGGTAGRTAETIIPTYDAVVAATLALQNIIKGYCREAGFSEAQGTNLQDTLAEISTLIEQHKVDGGDS